MIKTLECVAFDVNKKQLPVLVCFYLGPLMFWQRLCQFFMRLLFFFFLSSQLSV